ncbi:MAG TPA: mycothiol synthase, partial [Mycobacterium sp.]|nr:mycothiol synthase [Mycobacterium sp.]
MTTPDWRPALSGDEQQQVRELVAAAHEFDGVAPVGEHVLRELAGQRTMHLLTRDAGMGSDAVVGYLNLTA